MSEDKQVRAPLSLHEGLIPEVNGDSAIAAARGALADARHAAESLAAAVNATAADPC